ncbi:MAG: hypothetical protein RLZZ519_1429 [Bacteroidota bacterium]
MKNIHTYFREGLLMVAGIGFGLTAAAQMVVVNVSINQPAALVANAGSPNGIQLCEGDTVTLGGTPAAMGGTAPFFYLWSPSTTMSGATLANPQAWPGANAVYSLMVTDSNNCTSTGSVSLTVSTIPTSAFNFNSNGLAVTFTDQSAGTVTDWLWDFGDGNTSTSQNPTHTYANAGQYTVCLTASNNGCGQESCIPLTVIVGVEDAMTFPGIQLAPNPFQGETQLRFAMTEADHVRLEAYDVQGKFVALVFDGMETAGDKAIAFNPSKLGASAGIYLLKLTVGEKTGWIKGVKSE